MSYQVLARKWRPRIFREMVGQEHVLQALINALDHNRLHHAYLFTGTRGVGKTTIARILAKCLNCEQGVSSEPCGQCGACNEIAEGRFVDLIEVDAASRTKVEDTRELLDNVQYAPSRGRYKVYLIDEVHMLSNSSFNALLKTLEEPPPHVKFLLATTDPQKLPVTVLSRCLQFNLKNMNPERIVGHLQHVLSQEMVPFDDASLWQLGRAADGSMRDALSLTDQAIAFGSGKIVDAEVRSMLGNLDQSLVMAMVAALAQQDGAELLAVVERMSQQAPDYNAALGELLGLLHRIAIAQALPEAVDNSAGDKDLVLAMAAEIAAEDIQLFYQTALLGRRDLPLSPDPRGGFEMVLLRMLAFKPQGVPKVPQQRLASASNSAPAAPVSASVPPQPPAGQAPAGPEPVPAAAIAAPMAELVENPAPQNLAPQYTESQNTAPEPVAVSQQTAAPVPLVQAAMAQPQASAEPAVNPAPAQPAAPTLTEVTAPLPKAELPAAELADIRGLAQDLGQVAEGLSFDTEIAEPSAPQEPSAIQEPSAPQEPSVIQGHSAPQEPSVIQGHSAPQEPPGLQQPAAENQEPSAIQPPSASQVVSIAEPVESMVRSAVGANSVLSELSAPGAAPQLSRCENTEQVAVVKQAEPQLQAIALSDLSAEQWIPIYRQVKFEGVLQATASNCVLLGHSGTELVLGLDRNQTMLYDDKHQQRIADLLSHYFAQAISVRIELTTPQWETPAAYIARLKQQRLDEAKAAINTDPAIIQLIEEFDARVVADSITPID